MKAHTPSALLLFLLALAPFAVAAQPSPVGDDFQVNAYTTGGQSSSSVAMGASGQFVAVWSSPGSPGTDDDELSVLGRRFDSDGAAIGDDFQVNTSTVGEQDYPDVDMGEDGGFVVVWQSRPSAAADVVARVFAPDGTAVGGELIVNSDRPLFLGDPAVGVLRSGDFVVAWSASDSVGTDTSLDSVQARLFAPDGSGIGDQFQVNTYTSFSQGAPAVAARDDGGFIVAWESNGSSGADTSSRSIQGQIFDAAGAAVGDQFEVNSYTTSLQRSPSVDTSGDGAFTVVWSSPGSSGTDTDDRSILGQRFSPDGQRVGDEIQINTLTTGRQVEPQVASLETARLGRFGG